MQESLNSGSLRNAFKELFAEEVCESFKELLRAELRCELDKYYNGASSTRLHGHFAPAHRGLEATSKRGRTTQMSIPPKADRSTNALRNLFSKRARTTTFQKRQNLSMYSMQSVESRVPDAYTGEESHRLHAVTDDTREDTQDTSSRRALLGRTDTLDLSSRTHREDTDVIMPTNAHDSYQLLSREDTQDVRGKAQVGFRTTVEDVYDRRMTAAMSRRRTTRLSMASIRGFCAGNMFSIIAGLMVVLNALCVGIEADYRINHNGHSPSFAAVSETGFCIFFVTEISVRLWYEGKEFWCGDDGAWNVFDVFVIALQVVEQVVLALVLLPVSVKLNANLSVLRLARVLRIVRIMRLIRVFHLFDELRQLVGAMASSVSVLVWSLLILLLVIYMFSVVFLQCILFSEDGLDHSQIQHYFGSLVRTIFTMFESIVGGVNWDDVVAPLMQHISPFLGVVFCVYVGTSMFSIMNMLTGVFVDRVMQGVREDKDRVLAVQIKNLFLPADADEYDEIDWLSFKEKIQTPVMQRYLAELNLNTTEAEGLFDFLDADKSGVVTSREIVDGCLRLRGPARALELALIMREVGVARADIEELRQFMEER